MPKKFLISLGIVLLFTVGLIGTHTFIDRHNRRELIPVSPSIHKAQPNTRDSSPAAKQTPAVAIPSFDKKKYSIDDPSSIWTIVNKKRALNPESYAPDDLTSVGGNQQIRKVAATALLALISSAKNEGLNISPLSGYRSYTTQVSVYDNEVKNYGQAVADTESARPGTSEHQTGWAIDVGGGGCGIEDCFGQTPEGRWLASHAYEYGFIIRYTAEKQAITGYRAEPWHIRYIGSELAKEMHEQGATTLEEFFGL